MVSTAPVGLSLQFRERDASPQPAPDVEAFLRPRPRSRDAGARPRGEPIGVLPGRRALAPEAPLLVFFQHPEFGIPGHGYTLDLPDLSQWSQRPTVFGWIASVPRRRVGPGRPRAAWVLASCLSLALPSEALAVESAPVQHPRAADVPLAPATGSVDAEGPASATDASESDASTSTDPAPETAKRPPDPPKPGALGPAPEIVAAAWEGVDGYLVVLELKGGKTLKGTVGAVQHDTFTLIEAATGQVLVLPKSGVISLKVYIPPPLPAKEGAGLLIGGGVLTALASPVFITGLTFVILCPSCTYLHLPMLIVGGGALAAGIPMLVKGTRRRQAFRRAVEERKMSPILARTRHGGWMGGLQFQF